MMNNLYKITDKLSQSNLYKHFIKLPDQHCVNMDDVIKMAQNIAIKMTKQLKLHTQENE